MDTKQKPRLSTPYLSFFLHNAGAIQKARELFGSDYDVAYATREEILQIQQELYKEI